MIAKILKGTNSGECNQNGKNIMSEQFENAIKILWASVGKENRRRLNRGIE